MREVVCSLMILTLLIVPVTALSQEAESDPCEQAKYDARNDIRSWQWVGIGCVFNLLGVGAAYLSKPTPPPDRLLGKSPEYVEAYSDCFLKSSRKVKGGYAWIGCGGAGVSALLTYLLMCILVKAASSAGESCGDSCGNALGDACAESIQCSRGW